MTFFDSWAVLPSPVFPKSRTRAHSTERAIAVESFAASAYQLREYLKEVEVRPGCTSRKNPQKRHFFASDPELLDKWKRDIPRADKACKMYAIVEFDDGKEKTVEIVPCTWLQEDKCLWPNVAPDKAARMAKKGQPPGPGFRIFSAAVKGVFGSYELGRKKLQMAQFTSDLSGDEEVPRKRRRVKPARWISDSTSSESSDSFPSTPATLATSQPYQHNVSDVDVAPSTSQESGHQRPPVVFPLIMSTSTSSGAPHPGQETLGQEGLQTSQGPSMCSEDRGPGNSGKVLSCAEFQRRVLTGMSVIRRTQIEILEILQSLANGNGHIEHQDEPVLAGPLASVEAVLAFDETLTGGPREALIAELASFGGTTIAASVKAMMAHVINNEVAAKFSMEGRKGKERFRTLKLCGVIVDAVRRSKFLGDCVRAEIEVHIKEWLRRSKERAASGSKKET